MREQFVLMASTHFAKAKRLLLILADSTILSLPFSVLRLSSDPAKSIAEAVLTLASLSVEIVSLMPRIAWDLEEAAFSYQVSAKIVTIIVHLESHLSRTSRAVDVRLVVQTLKIFQTLTRSFRQSNYYSLSSIIAQG